MARARRFFTVYLDRLVWGGMIASKQRAGKGKPFSENSSLLV